MSKNNTPSNTGRTRIWNGKDKRILRNKTTLLTMFQFSLVSRRLCILSPERTQYLLCTRSCDDNSCKLFHRNKCALQRIIYSAGICTLYFSYHSIDS